MMKQIKLFLMLEKKKKNIEALSKAEELNLKTKKNLKIS